MWTFVEQRNCVVQTEMFTSHKTKIVTTHLHATTFRNILQLIIRNFLNLMCLLAQLIIIVFVSSYASKLIVLNVFVFDFACDVVSFTRSITMLKVNYLSI